MSDVLDLAAKVLAVLGSLVSLVLGAVRLVREVRGAADPDAATGSPPYRRLSPPPAAIPWLGLGIAGGLAATGLGVGTLLLAQLASRGRPGTPAVQPDPPDRKALEDRLAGRDDPGRAERERKHRAYLTGRWAVAGGPDRGAVVEFTPGGTVLLTGGASAVRGDESATAFYEFGNYSWPRDADVMIKERSEGLGDHSVFFRVERLSDDEMILNKVWNRLPTRFDQLSGRLRRVR